MNFTVLWLPDAESELADIWTRSADKAVVTQAANDIDARLQADPEGEGESRDRGRRVIYAPPLGALYVVLRQDRKVFVISVWRFRKRGKKA